MSKIQVTLNIDDAHILQESEALHLEDAITRELGWLHDSGMSVEAWSFLEREPEKKPLQSYYYTFGTSDIYPYKKGWVEVKAQDRNQADQLFRSKYPDKIPGYINCSSIYDEEDFKHTLDKHYKNSPDWLICHDTIIQPDPREQQRIMLTELEAQLKNDEYQNQFYTAMDEDIAKAIQTDEEKPGHKYQQLVTDYIAGTDETRRIIDKAVCSITGWNLSTILRNTKTLSDEWTLKQDYKQPMLSSIMKSAENRKTKQHTKDIENTQLDRENERGGERES